MAFCFSLKANAFLFFLNTENSQTIQTFLHPVIVLQLEASICVPCQQTLYLKQTVKAICGLPRFTKVDKQVIL